jgi:hypothetical protein
MKKEGFRRKTTFEKKKGLVRVAWVMGRPASSTEFCRVFTLANILPYSN